MDRVQKSEKYIVGTCQEMCPKKERQLREKERLLHVLEIVPGTESTRCPKADVARAVKCFSRSAAGRSPQREADLRPPRVLLHTVRYLLTKVAESSERPWPAIYDFIMDRLRAVRQDLVIQNASKKEWIDILKPIVNFHAYSAYRLCPEDVSNFDPSINKTHLQECLKRLLSTYDDLDMAHELNIQYDDTLDSKYEFHLSYRHNYEALYIVLNLGSEEALMRALSLKKVFRNGIVRKCIELSLSYRENNFIRACRIMSQLPALLAGLASLHLPELRRKAFMAMSVAYSSKNLKIPTKWIGKHLLYNSEQEVIDDCKHYGVACSGEEIRFCKGDFDNTAVLTSPRHHKFVEEALRCCPLHALLLF